MTRLESLTHKAASPGGLTKTEIDEWHTRQRNPYWLADMPADEFGMEVFRTLWSSDIASGTAICRINEDGTVSRIAPVEFYKGRPHFAPDAAKTNAGAL